MDSQGPFIVPVDAYHITYYIVIAILAVLLLVNLCLDTNYFCRLGIVVFRARFCKKKAHVLDTLTTNSWCWSTDIDYLLTHLNNAKYLRELDFARADFYQRTRLYQKIRSKGGGLVQGATTIRYRKFIKVFTMFKITSKIVFWDKANIYMEHRFLAPGDNFICAIAICKQRIINVDIEELMRNILMGEKSPAGIEAGYSKPQMQLSLKKWVESNEISSADLRNSC